MVIPQPGADVDVAEFAARVTDRLSSFKRPAEWIVGSTLRPTSTGKVRKHLLREWYQAGTLETNCAPI